MSTFSGEDHYSSSASVLRFVLEKRKEAGNTLLALAYPEDKYFAKEVETAARLYDTQPLVGEDATESVVKARAGEYSFVHLSVDGELNEHNPLFSAVLLAPDEENDGRLEVHEVYGLDLGETDLVVLSACETKLGKLLGGDEIVGLHRAFIYAGTPSVVASLWSVEARSTAVLMERFYEHLKKGMNKAEALRQAQLETMRDYPNPFYWAGFSLVGDYGGPAPTAVEVEGPIEVPPVPTSVEVERPVEPTAVPVADRGKCIFGGSLAILLVGLAVVLWWRKG